MINLNAKRFIICEARTGTSVEKRLSVEASHLQVDPYGGRGA